MSPAAVVSDAASVAAEMRVLDERAEQFMLAGRLAESEAVSYAAYNRLCWRPNGQERSGLEHDAIHRELIDGSERYPEWMRDHLR